MYKQKRCVRNAQRKNSSISLRKEQELKVRIENFKKFMDETGMTPNEVVTEFCKRLSAQTSLVTTLFNTSDEVVDGIEKNLNVVGCDKELGKVVDAFRRAVAKFKVASEDFIIADTFMRQFIPELNKLGDIELGNWTAISTVLYQASGTKPDGTAMDNDKTVIIAPKAVYNVMKTMPMIQAMKGKIVEVS